MLGPETRTDKGPENGENGEEDDGAAFSAFLSGDTTALNASKDSIKHHVPNRILAPVTRELRWLFVAFFVAFLVAFAFLSLLLSLFSSLLRF